MRLTNYQRIYSDTLPAAQQLFTCLFTYLLHISYVLDVGVHIEPKVIPASGSIDFQSEGAC